MGRLAVTSPALPPDLEALPEGERSRFRNIEMVIYRDGGGVLERSTLERAMSFTLSPEPLAKAVRTLLRAGRIQARQAYKEGATLAEEGEVSVAYALVPPVAAEWGEYFAQKALRAAQQAEAEAATRLVEAAEKEALAARAAARAAQLAAEAAQLAVRQAQADAEQARATAAALAEGA